WFAEDGTGKIANIQPASGTITEYSIPTATSGPWGISSGPNNTIWFTESLTSKVAKFLWDPSGGATNIADPVQGTAVPFGPAQIAPLDGNVNLVHPLLLGQSSPNPSDPPLPTALVYSSNTVSVKPIIQATYQSDPNGSVPSPISVTLTWNGPP